VLTVHAQQLLLLLLLLAWLLASASLLSQTWLQWSAVRGPGNASTAAATWDTQEGLPVAAAAVALVAVVVHRAAAHLRTWCLPLLLLLLLVVVVLLLLAQRTVAARLAAAAEVHGHSIWVAGPAGPHWTAGLAAGLG
jgi:hypothetical protein